MPEIPYLPRPEGDMVGYLPARGLGMRGNPFLAHQQGLDKVRWSYRSRPYRALGLDFTVRTTDVVLGHFLDELFAHFAVPPGVAGTVAAASCYSVLTPGSGLLEGYAVSWNGRRLLTTDHPAHALRTMLTHLNGVVLDHADEQLLLLHAAAVTAGERAAVLSAPSGSGKSTLAAGLVLAGAGYLSDEIAAIDDRLSIRPFAKALSVDPGAWPVLPQLEPSVPASLVPYLTEQWQVPPDAIRPGAAVLGATAALIVVPTYRKGSTLAVEQLQPAAAVMVLADQTFGFNRAPQRHLERLAEITTGVPCYRMVHGDLEEAVRTVLQLLEAV